MALQLLYTDDRVVVCIKPAGVVSVDEPGGLPQLVREALGEPQATLRTVHRLDQAVSGVMVLARTARAAADLSRQIQEGRFGKEYLALVHGEPAESGVLQDLLGRDKQRRITYVAREPGKDVQEASLSYRVLERRDGCSLVAISLHTGRTHQIRVQFSSRGFPLVGDRKYGRGEDGGIRLWSHSVSFFHPRTNAPMTFTQEPAWAE